MTIDYMDALLDRCVKLKNILSEHPEIESVLRLLDKTDSKTAIMLNKTDRLIGTEEAIDILKVSDENFRSFWKTGILNVYYTPGSRNKKFWLSEVMAIPQRGDK